MKFERLPFVFQRAGAELDLLLFKHGRDGIEIKREDAPRLTPSMRIALHDLRLDHLSVYQQNWTARLKRQGVVRKI
ncbi:MAG TPA: hypothetical protein VJB15_03505 [Rhodothermia bacterium]|nr:hypothetical protein [Rhodothermia bacterium]